MVLVGLLFAAACTSPNPRSCADGACTDPSLPFCDVDGAISGTPQQCIAGDCTANEVKGCRGKTAVVCNAEGTNYELKSCTDRCDDALGCIECTSDTECSSAEPHCDVTTHGCRGCQADAECASNVCSTTAGTCVDASTLIYASPNGSLAASCGSQQMPCDLPTAIAHADNAKNTIKLQQGTYTIAPVDLTNGKNVTILGSGSTLSGGLNPLFNVKDTSRLALQDATVLSVINCTSTSTQLPELRLDGVHFEQGKGIGAKPCKVVATRTTFSVMPPNGGLALSVTLPLSGGGSSDITLDRVHLLNVGLTVSGAGNRLTMTNSVVDGTNTNFGASLNFEMGASGVISFSTLVNAPATCSSSSVSFENSIMFGTMANDVLYEISAVCPVHYSLMNPQAMVYTGWDHVLRNVDPLLTSLPNKDFHLLATSPAIDAADPAASLSTDIAGTPRPQGTRLDMGAYEYKP